MKQDDAYCGALKQNLATPRRTASVCRSCNSQSGQCEETKFYHELYPSKIKRIYRISQVYYFH